MHILFIFLFTFSFLFLSTLIKNKFIRCVVIFFASSFVLAQIVSLFFGSNYVDYQFYINLNLKSLFSGIKIFKLETLISTIVFAILIFVFYKSSNYLSKITKKLQLFSFFSSLILLVSFFCGAHGPFVKFYEIFAITLAPETKFDKALDNLGINHTNYVKKDDLLARKGKNIIVISLESVERGFMSNQFNDLTPNLIELTKRFNYFKSMPMGTGSSWTLASLYTYMTGVPLLVGSHYMDPFFHTNSTELVALPDVLKVANYQLYYALGNPSFASMDKAIHSFGIEVIFSEKSEKDRYPKAPFGLYDKDLFDLAKAKINKIKTNDKPFAFFMSTVSTHAPTGFPDQRMKNIISPRETPYEFALGSVDYLLGDFIQFLEKENLLENTAIFIFPDHLLMGRGTATIKRLSRNQRSLYLITNANLADLKADPNQPIYQIDLPRLILNGANVHSNAKFLTDFLPKDSIKTKFINEHKKEIATLNAAAMGID